MSALQVQKAGVDHPGEIVCTGPKYQYSYATDSAHVHLSAQEYERVGEKTAQVYFERVVLGHDWQPLQPTSARGERQCRHRALSRAGPAADLGRRAAGAARPMTAEWAAGRGFEVQRRRRAQDDHRRRDRRDDTVQITCASDLSGLQVVVGYAATAEGGTPPAAQPARWGQLRDSDPFMGAVTGSAQPNYCVAFQMTL